VRRNGATPVLLFSGVTFMIDVVCGVAGFTAVVSYTHIYDPGRAHGRTGRPLRLLRGNSYVQGLKPGWHGICWISASFLWCVSECT
jgi:hypothetical protein